MYSIYVGEFLNIHFLLSAPYGPIAVEYSAIKLSDRACVQCDVFIAYISPSAYLTAEHAPHGRVANCFSCEYGQFTAREAAYVFIIMQYTFLKTYVLLYTCVSEDRKL